MNTCPILGAIESSCMLCLGILVNPLQVGVSPIHVLFDDELESFYQQHRAPSIGPGMLVSLIQSIQRHGSSDLGQLPLTRVALVILPFESQEDVDLQLSPHHHMLVELDSLEEFLQLPPRTASPLPVFLSLCPLCPPRPLSQELSSFDSAHEALVTLLLLGQAQAFGHLLLDLLHHLSF